MQKKICILICFLAFYGILFAQQPAFISDSLDSYIENGMKQWDVPGLAIAIVKDGKVVTMKGFGVRDVKTQEPVDENTLFMIASNSKLFTATSLAQLEKDKKLSLDDKIIKYFPDYRLFDPVITKLVTIRDMLSHHLGTKTFQGDFTFWDSKLTRQQIMYKMRFLKPSQNFRQSYGYCNSCFLTAGQIIEKVTGKPWEEYINDSILKPLGMVNTYALSKYINQISNVSKAYTNNFTGVLTELAYDNADNLAPATAMISNVKDLSKWLVMQLDSGRLEGKTIISWPTLRLTRQMQTIISSNRSSYIPSHFVGYGLGVVEYDFNGKQVYGHTGGVNGFLSDVCFVPEDKLGITILTNNDNQDFFEDLRFQILNAYLGGEYVNWNDMDWKISKPDFDSTVKKIKALQARINGNKPKLNLSAYTGTYQNKLFGPITIISDKTDLIILFPNEQNLSAKLQYMDNDEWLMTYSNLAFGIFPLKFKIEKNKVMSTDIKVNDFLEYDTYSFIKNK